MVQYQTLHQQLFGMVCTLLHYEQGTWGQMVGLVTYVTGSIPIVRLVPAKILPIYPEDHKLYDAAWHQFLTDLLYPMNPLSQYPLLGMALWSKRISGILMPKPESAEDVPLPADCDSV